MNAPRCLAALAAAAAVSWLAACSSTETVATTKRPPRQEVRRFYSQERLKNTGENTIGEGLAKADPSFQIAADR